MTRILSLEELKKISV